MSLETYASQFENNTGESRAGKSLNFKNLINNQSDAEVYSGSSQQSNNTHGTEQFLPQVGIPPSPSDTALQNAFTSAYNALDTAISATSQLQNENFLSEAQATSFDSSLITDLTTLTNDLAQYSQLEGNGANGGGASGVISENTGTNTVGNGLDQSIYTPQTDPVIEAMTNPNSPQGTDPLVAQVLTDAFGQVSSGQLSQAGYTQFEAIASADTQSIGTYANDPSLLSSALQQFQGAGGSASDVAALSGVISTDEANDNPSTAVVLSQNSGSDTQSAASGAPVNGSDTQPVASSSSPGSSDAQTVVSSASTGGSDTQPLTSTAPTGGDSSSSTTGGDSTDQTTNSNGSAPVNTASASSSNSETDNNGSSLASVGALTGDVGAAATGTGADAGGWTADFTNPNTAQSVLDANLPVQWGNVSVNPSGGINISAAGGESNVAQTGFMATDSSASDGNGYGVYSTTMSVSGDGSGIYQALWPASNVWPGPEEDGWENYGGQQMSTQHWEGSGDSNQYNPNPINGINQNEPFTVTQVWEPNSQGVPTLTEYVNQGGALANPEVASNEVYSTSTNVPTDYANGGQNLSIGVGSETSDNDPSSGSNGTIYGISYTPDPNSQ